MISDLPQDLIEEILSRVPVTSLRQLRSTCKRWYHQALFKDPRFIKKYFDKTARQYHALLLIDNRVSLMSSVLDKIKTGIHLALGGQRLTVPHCNNETVDLSRAFHCDGILLCTPFKMNMIVVWNPFSGQTRWIQLQNEYMGAYALGYDNNELFRSYKILRFPCSYGKLASSWWALDVTQEGGIKLEIYEFSSNSWRNLDAIIPAHQAYFKPKSGVSLNGNTYWVSCNKKGDDDYSLLSFDFSTERFQRLCAHFHHETCHIDTMALSVIREEHLSLLYQSKKTLKVEIWMTDEIETTFVSWSKFFTLDFQCCFSYNMSFFIIDEEKKVVVCCDEFGISKYKMVWIVGEGEEYRLSPNFSVFRGIQGGCFTCIFNFPRLFGYVPKN